MTIIVQPDGWFWEAERVEADDVEVSLAPASPDVLVADLHRLHYDSLVGLAQLVVDTRGEAEEVVQEAFVRQQGGAGSQLLRASLGGGAPVAVDLGPLAPGGWFCAVAVSAEGRTLWFSYEEPGRSSCPFYRMQDGSISAVADGWVTDVAVSPDRQRLAFSRTGDILSGASPRENAVVIVDLRTGAERVIEQRSDDWGSAFDLVGGDARARPACRWARLS